MKICFAMVAVACLLSGCAATKQEVAENLGSRFIGKNVDSLVTEFGQPAPVSVTDAQEIAKGNKVFFVFGEIRYRDAFDKQRHTKFRLHHDNTASSSVVLLVSGEGNEET
jgi:hypothetical protein